LLIARLSVPKHPILDWVSFALGRPTTADGLDAHPHVLLTTSGRAAIALALDALDFAAGERVLVPSYHCPTMVSPVAARGGQASFYPIEETGLPSLARVDRMDLSHVRAMIAVHYFGLPLDFARVRRFCDERGIALIEDCAHAFFGHAGSRPVGAWGDLAIGSLTKFFPVSEGGCLVTTRKDLGAIALRPRGFRANVRVTVDVVELAAAHRRLRPLDTSVRAARGLVGAVRGVSRMHETTNPEPSAAAPLAFDSDLAGRQPAWVTRFILKHSDRERIIQRRRRNYAALAALLRPIKGARVMQPELPAEAVPYVLPLWVDEPERSYQALRAAGVPIFRWDIRWPNVPELDGDWGGLWARHVFQLGCHQDLELPEVEAIAATVRLLVERRA
jgi:dTDP-4-amino-4,6-dideoxygalactose transaminase